MRLPYRIRLRPSSLQNPRDPLPTLLHSYYINISIYDPATDSSIAALLRLISYLVVNTQVPHIQAAISYQHPS